MTRTDSEGGEDSVVISEEAAEGAASTKGSVPMRMRFSIVTAAVLAFGHCSTAREKWSAAPFSVLGRQTGLSLSLIHI